ncbi:MAG TPA: hypothetical protein VGF75_05045, partial [Candidatus Saccharimonadales bacterium]
MTPNTAPGGGGGGGGVTASANITASATSICSGASVSFLATGLELGTSPSYVWYVNGVAKIGGTDTYTTTTLTNGSTVYCYVTSSLTNVTNNPVKTNVVSITVTTASAPSVSISASATTVCAGTSVAFTATPTNGGSAPTYQWLSNGIAISGATGSTYISSSLTNGQVISCTMTSNAPCLTTTAATSNAITMTVNAVQSMSVNIT